MAGWMENDTIGIKYCYEIAKVKQEIDEDLKQISLKSLTSQIVNQCKSMGVVVVLDRDKPSPIKPHLKM